MTVEPDDVADQFGLAGPFPRRGWMVLDAAREQSFTGELAFDVQPAVRVYLDLGRIYLAEREHEAPLGTRLVDAGALNGEQLEHGSMVVGDTAHLGRLFDRVPSIDRHLVLLMTEMMNDECVAWVAGQEIGGVTTTPYLHHPSGIHRWDRRDDADDVDLAPGDPLPAPPPTASPVAPAAPPAPAETDTLVSWGDPTPTAAPAAAPIAAPSSDSTPDAEQADWTAPEPPEAAPSDSILDTDWADRLETHGLPEVGSDPLARPASLPPLAAEQPAPFELIWPSGEVDEDFDATAVVDSGRKPDHDRAGPTARVVRSAELQPAPNAGLGTDTIELWDFETTPPSFGPVELEADIDHESSDPHLPVVTDDAVLSMRQAVESIEAGAIATRVADQTSNTQPAPSEAELAVPGRVATRTESSLWSVRGFESSTTRSVFDEIEPTPALPSAPSEDPVLPAQATPVEAAVDVEAAEQPRVSALRRLIGGLRRR